MMQTIEDVNVESDPSTGGRTMRALVHERYGSPDVLEIRQLDKPQVEDDGVLVRVRAAAINPIDLYGLTGTPWVGRVQMGMRKPKDGRIGIDFAGTVEAVGKNVTGFTAGDEVFGAGAGALAEYVCAQNALAHKPANAAFEQAASVSVAGRTALQGLRDHGKVEPGQKVLINGASGGVGTFAVQIAKALGAEVTAVCSTRNVETARSLGADRVIDYTREDFTKIGVRHDVLLDVTGTRSWREYERVLEPEAVFVAVGAPKSSRLLGPLTHIAKVRLGSLRSSRKFVFFITKRNEADLRFLAELIEAGKLTPVVDRAYPLSEAADAFRYLGEGHARGKIVITI